MRTIIVGGGKIGSNLIKTLGNKHKVTLVDLNKNVCNTIADISNDLVIWGDGTDLEILKDAGIGQVETIVAVTNKDENNFIICQLAKLYSGIRTIAYINNPNNKEYFKKMGIDHIICSADAITSLFS
jgi:trk system potassium uptake protein TrkA